MVAYGHPRLPGTTNADRPSVAAGIRGTIVTWTDDHEQPGHDHAYSVVLAEDGHALSSPRDLTPEASQILRASLLPAGERTVLLYSDNQGREAGVHTRWLDADGRIAGASTLVGARRPGRYWPAMDRTPDGYVVVWQDDRDKEGDDLFARRLGPELDPIGPELRLTDYHGPLGKGPNVRVPTVAVASNAMVIAYKLERDNQNLIMRMRVPLDDPNLQNGLPDEKLGIKPKDREIGDVQLVNEDKTAGDAPAVGCGTEGCFLAWNHLLGGASVALIDPAHGKVIWRKKFAPNGSRPTIGVGVDGAVYVAYFEKGQVKIAPLTRDGLGPVSVVGKVSGDQPRPALAGARTAGEWLVAWQDAEGNHAEVHVARAVCK
jgi:serine/threonine-protein kinase